MKRLLVVLLLFAGMAHAEVECTWIANAAAVDVGEHIYVTYAVATNDTAFNAYDTRFEFDPALVTFLGVSEGNYMVNACGATFWWVREQSTYIEAAHSLWCQGVLLHDTGELAVLEFQATAPGVAVFTPTHVEFYAAGYTVPSSAVGCAVTITSLGGCTLPGGTP